MKENELYNQIVGKELRENYDNDFDMLLFSNYFSEIVDIEELTRIKIDNYGDVGNDYIFFALNRKQLFEYDDVESIDLSNEKNIIDVYFVQVKNSQKLDSNVFML